MVQIANWFMEGGIFMWIILALDLLLFGLAILALAAAVARPGKPAAQIAALVAALIPAGLGGLGAWSGNRQVEAALAAAAPEMREELARVGSGYAAIPLKFGLGSSALLVLICGAALALALSARRG